MSLHQHLADALDKAAMQLAFHQQRIDDGAEIVDRGVFHHLDDAGLRIDLDLGDMAAIGKCGRHRLAREFHVERFRRIVAAA